MFLVCPLATETVGLLGMDFLERKGAEISVEKGSLSLSAITGEPPEHVVTLVKHAALTVFPGGKA